MSDCGRNWLIHKVKSPAIPKNNEAFWKRAEDGTRTRDPNLGKVMLYQLSYFRKMCVAQTCVLEAGLEPAQPQWPKDFKSFVSTDSTIRASLSLKRWAEDGTRTRDPNLGKVMLYQLSYFRIVALFSFASAKVDEIFVSANIWIKKLRLILCFLIYHDPFLSSGRIGRDCISS